MRKMVYRLDNDTVVNTWAETAGHHYKVEMISITPPDEIEARIKFNADRVKRGFKVLLPIPAK